MIDHVFVYGTLRPGDVRWHFLEPFAIDEGDPDAVAGELFDTGFDYPAARFREHGGTAEQSTIRGQTLRLHRATLARALTVLDDVEGVVDGEYRRVEVTTARGVVAWAYACGPGLDLTPIESGDWFLHRPIPPRPHPSR
jgi:gamma-glutamylcyclotransferase (GGCT)/AIG2-like uncharacterized protein YtfP